MMATIFNFSNLNDGSHGLTHAAQISVFSHLSSFWLKPIHFDSHLMMASHLELCHHGFSYFAQKKLHSFILTQLDEWQPSWILASWIQPFCTKRTLLIHSDSTWWWQPSWNLPSWIQTWPSWIQTPCYLLSDSLKNTLPLLWLCLKLIPSD